LLKKAAGDIFIGNLVKTRRETMAQAQQTTKEKAQGQTQFKPLGNRVLVKRLDHTEQLKGGILLPDSAKKKQEQAEVIAIGTGKFDKNNNLIAIPVKVGDIVLMDKYSGQEVKLDDQEYIIVAADDLIAIVEK
jgi:chaperonin GroES